MREPLGLLQMPWDVLATFLVGEAVENPVIDLDLTPDSPEPRVPAASGESLGDFLRRQLAEEDVGATCGTVCDYLIDSLDERGYLPEGVIPPGGLSTEGKRTINEALERLQSLDPSGVGARDLAECLRLQLDRVPDVPTACFAVVDGCLALVAENRVRAIASRAGVSVEEARACCAIVRGLSPIPSRGFGTGSDAVPVTPEATIREEADGTLSVEPTTTYPDAIRLDPRYVLLSSTSPDAGTRSYLEGHIERARRLQREVSARESTVLSVIRALARHQRAAFVCGRDALVPLAMGEVSAELGIDESTVGRAVQDKWVLAPCGLVPLRSLFSTTSLPAGGRDPDDFPAVSPEGVRRQVRSLIEGEDASRPLSDRAVSDRLSERGMHVSRRAVAKHRAAMGIPTAALRRG